MWILPSRNRPCLAQHVLDICVMTHMQSRGVLYVDQRVYPYGNIMCPPNWEVVHGDLDLQPCFQWCFETYPDEEFYGVLSDDTVPRTAYWDRCLEMGAGKWGISDANDLWGDEKVRAYSLSDTTCWSGNLVRAVGWWALEGLIRSGHDDVWNEIICRRMPVRRKYLMDVIVEHLNPRNEKRPADDTDTMTNGLERVNGVDPWKDALENDQRVMAEWKENKGPEKAVEAICAAMQAEGRNPYA